MQRQPLILTIIVSAMLASAGCAGSRAALHGEPVPNFHRVDAQLYRGGQPTAEGFRRLADLGVKTVISLRAYGHTARREQVERRMVESLGMRWVSMPMRMYWRPSDEQVRAFLTLTGAAGDGPAFVHCQHGEDRTGSLVAVYRVARQGWAPERAYSEALTLGMAPWNPFTRRLITSTEPTSTVVAQDPQ
jgi:protein tyrosine/serine phosphatase